MKQFQLWLYNHIELKMFIKRHSSPQSSPRGNILCQSSRWTSCSSGCINRQSAKRAGGQRKEIRRQERRDVELRHRTVPRLRIGKANSSIKGSRASEARSRPPPRTQQTVEEAGTSRRVEALRATRQVRARIEGQTCPRQQQMEAMRQREAA